MTRFLLALFLFAGTAAAQTISTEPVTTTAPAGSVVDCTANVVGTNDKTVTWTKTGGTFYGTNPGVANEPNTIALYTTTPGTYTVTATANAGTHPTSTCVITITSSPTAVTTYPRGAGVNPSNVAALQAKAVSGNPMFASGVEAIATGFYAAYSSGWNY